MTSRTVEVNYYSYIAMVSSVFILVGAIMTNFVIRNQEELKTFFSDVSTWIVSCVSEGDCGYPERNSALEIPFLPAEEPEVFASI